MESLASIAGYKYKHRQARKRCHMLELLWLVLFLILTGCLRIEIERPAPDNYHCYPPQNKNQTELSTGEDNDNFLDGVITGYLLS